MRTSAIETSDIIIEDIKTEVKKIKGNILGSNGRPKKEDNEKANNKIVLYFTDEEIKQLENACYLEGVKARNKGKWCKSQILKALRRV